MQTPNEKADDEANDKQDDKSPVSLYAMPFAGPGDCIFSLPERPATSVRPSRNPAAPPTISKLLGEITIPVIGSSMSVTATVWEATQDLPDGVQTSTGFSLPRNIPLPKDNYGRRTREYYEARDVENGWKHSVVAAFLSWLTKQTDKQIAAVGGNVVSTAPRLVKKQTAA